MKPINALLVCATAWSSACVAEEDVELSQRESSSQEGATPQEAVTIEPAGAANAPITTLGVGCNYSWSSPSNQCTGGVREWKGGCASSGYTYGGVPWSGHAYQWWANGSAYRANRPASGYIVVFGPSNYNGNYGHVGVVTWWDTVGHNVYFKSRNWKSGDYTGTVSEYLAACGGCQLYGYLSYF
jgi:hypothetical protein